MGRNQWRVGRILLWWGLTLTCIVAMLQGASSAGGVVALVIIGGIAGTLAIIEHRWYRSWIWIGTAIKSVCLFSIPWVFMVGVGWYVWPKNVEHTTLSWTTPGATSHSFFPLFPGEVPSANLGFSNWGQYTVTSSKIWAALLIIDGAEDQSKVFDDNIVRIMKGQFIAGGTVVPHKPQIAYFTFNGPVLTQADVDDLNAIPGKKMLCAIGAVEWVDASGEYRTDLNQCFFRQVTGVFNWHTGDENDREMKIDSN